MWSYVGDEFGLRVRSRGGGGGGGGRTSRLDVMAIWKGGRSTQRCVAEVAIGGGINVEDKVRKPHKDTPHFFRSHKPTTSLFVMGTETVKRVAELRDMENIPNEHRFAVEGDNGGAFAQDWGARLVAHADPHVGDPVIRDEGRTIRDHVVSGTSVRDNKLRRVCLHADGVTGSNNGVRRGPIGTDGFYKSRESRTYVCAAGGDIRGNGGFRVRERWIIQCAILITRPLKVIPRILRLVITRHMPRSRV
mmetsp:Transcript_13658/g.33071  ORF Transcript_13658/g.33071 Transcript_13658/m.33071 type:complete len:248 (+) Transcript_13658:3838-4581(+)